MSKPTQAAKTLVTLGAASRFRGRLRSQVRTGGPQRLLVGGQRGNQVALRPRAASFAIASW